MKVFGIRCTVKNNMQLLYEDDSVIIMADIDNESPNAILSFSSIFGVLKKERPEFVGILNQIDYPATKIFIMDKRISWGNAINWKTVKEKIGFLLEDKTNISSLGVSMGAFLAIYVSTLFDIKRVLAFKPQYSVDNKLFVDPRILIDPNISITIPSLDGCFNNDTNYFIFESTNEEDMAHFKYIPNKENVYKYIIWGTETMTPMRKISNELPDIIYSALTDNKDNVDKIFLDYEQQHAQNI
jgi:hypothetical protein